MLGTTGDSAISGKRLGRSPSSPGPPRCRTHRYCTQVPGCCGNSGGNISRTPRGRGTVSITCSIPPLRRFPQTGARDFQLPHLQPLASPPYQTSRSPIVSTTSRSLNTKLFNLMIRSTKNRRRLELKTNPHPNRTEVQFGIRSGVVVLRTKEVFRMTSVFVRTSLPNQSDRESQGIGLSDRKVSSLRDLWGNLLRLCSRFQRFRR